MAFWVENGILSVNGILIMPEFLPHIPGASPAGQALALAGGPIAAGPVGTITLFGTLGAKQAEWTG